MHNIHFNWNRFSVWSSIKLSTVQMLAVKLQTTVISPSWWDLTILDASLIYIVRRKAHFVIHCTVVLVLNTCKDSVPHLPTDSNMFRHWSVARSDQTGNTLAFPCFDLRGIRHRSDKNPTMQCLFLTLAKLIDVTVESEYLLIYRFTWYRYTCELLFLFGACLVKYRDWLASVCMVFMAKVIRLATS